MSRGFGVLGFWKFMSFTRIVKFEIYKFEDSFWIFLQSKEKTIRLFTIYQGVEKSEN